MSIKSFSEKAIKLGLHRSERNLNTYLELLFKGIQLEGKTFLDVGGGAGTFTHLASHMGATKAVCLEPILDGGTEGITDKFESIKTSMNSPGVVELDQRTFQDYDGEPFDIIFLNNSINHLDEPACVELTTSESAQKEYIKIFKKMYDTVNPGGIMIISDCGNRNFFGDLGLTNPFMKTIEWEKHQQPKVWAKMLSQAGFKTSKIRWNIFNSLGKPGQILLGYSLPSYFTISHFTLYVKKPL